jgi:GxxExxY protein
MFHAHISITNAWERIMSENEIARIILNAAIKVHTALGAGLLESAYRECLAYELRVSGLTVEKEKGLPLIYEEVHLHCGYRVDLFVENKVVVEIKAVEALHGLHLAQVLTYLRLIPCKLGLLINFNVPHLKNGIRRVVNGL